MPSTGASRAYMETCIFCKLSKGEHPQARLHEDDELFVVEDIHPHAPHHYLVITKSHIGRPTDLDSRDAGLVRRLEACGRNFLSARLKAVGEGDIMENKLRLGFHWPPLLSISHLHMHVIYPADQMYFFYRNFIFRPGRYFRTASTVATALESTMTPPADKSVAEEETGSSKI
uniref:Adenosine 5'-monophosphoramidase HINT3 n=1 Tax=Plectus sambesii TaxID=2011161 RepID=A0A914ULG0_9BILA